MKALIETKNRRTERVFLVGVELKARDPWEVQESLAELEQLATTAGAEVMAVLEELHEAGRTIVLITHEHDVAALADRQIHVRDGRILA